MTEHSDEQTSDGPNSRDTIEHERLRESPGANDPWRLWGPYLSGRQWGTVREDYSADGDAWNYFTFDDSHRRAYRWGEDGMGGLCDRYGFLNLALAMHNDHDDRLKERLFGLTNGQGNHGEDVKEYWWALDATPTHSWGQWMYRYPQKAFPYQDLIDTNAKRSRTEPEYELSDTGVLAENRFFDVTVTHAKAAPDDICMTITATNNGPDSAALTLIPQLWFRNTWSWGLDDRRPSLSLVAPHDLPVGGIVAIDAEHGFLGEYRLFVEGTPEVMFCDNESDTKTLFGDDKHAPAHPKNAINDAIVHGDVSHLNPHNTGTKAGIKCRFDAVAAGATVTVRLRLTRDKNKDSIFGDSFDAVLQDRQSESNDFYDAVIPTGACDADYHVARRAFAGLMWNKQHYRYDVQQWLDGDPTEPDPPAQRRKPEPKGRNTSWKHLYLADVISMPDEWEYPWFASWDLAFHCVTIAHIDPEFAKQQLVLMCREWAQHPDGELPAYEWSFSDVNPPVHAWAAWDVFALDGAKDHHFLRRVFGKLILNFGWWVNRKDADGSDLFEGGFLGMDNISVINRSQDIPDGWRLEQSDATSWMAFFCASMLRISMELSRIDPAWDDMASTFVERFLSITDAANAFGSEKVSLWDEKDGFFYDTLVNDDQTKEAVPLRIRSLVGLLPLLGVAEIPGWASTELPQFTRHLQWMVRHHTNEIGGFVGSTINKDLSIVMLEPKRYLRLVSYMFDESEFFSKHGVRSLSAYYRGGKEIAVGDQHAHIAYTPAESNTPLFGGNSNWRGPIWFPINTLLVKALRRYGESAGKDLKVEVPTGSGNAMSLGQAADELETRLIQMFRPDSTGKRASDPRDIGEGTLWNQHPTFSEYFDGDTGRGLGASHQTGWTALVAHLICDRGSRPLQAGQDVKTTS